MSGIRSLSSVCECDLGSGPGGRSWPLTPFAYPAGPTLYGLAHKGHQMLAMAGLPRLAMQSWEVRLGYAADLVAVEPPGHLMILGEEQEYGVPNQFMRRSRGQHQDPAAETTQFSSAQLLARSR